jgi:23S rRNA (adenine2503-C2)-methyltransferase
MTTRYDIARRDLEDLLPDEPGYRVDQIWDGLYRNLAAPGAMTNLPKELRQTLEELLPPALYPVSEAASDGGSTVKSLWALPDGRLIETVLMHYPDRSTVCISSQAGCAMGCGFCATGQMGFERQLTVGEIVEQVVAAAQRARPRRLANVVFMGMGEPLANLDNVWTAVHRMHDDIGIGARHITVSTVGLVPGIDRIAAGGLPVNLAVSLHAANDAKRDELVPINRRYPLGELAAACQRYVRTTRRRLSIEWAMIDGVNDGPDDAAELAAFALPLRAHVNLIPLNPTEGWPTAPSPRATIHAFRDELARRGVNTTIRRNRGTDIDAACGQLRARFTPTALSAPARRLPH